MRINIFLLFCFTVVIGCEQPTSIDTFADLYVRYDAELRELSAEAGFNSVENGEIGESKVFPSGVLFINSGMRTVELGKGEIRYKAGVSGLLPKETYFTWYGKNGLPITIPASVTKINGFEVTSDSLSLSNGFSIYLNTSNLESSEKLVISIVDKNGKAKSLETKGPTFSSKFKIPGSELNGLAIGSAYLHVVRSSTLEIKGDSHRTILNTEYYTAPKKVEITD